MYKIMLFFFSFLIPSYKTILWVVKVFISVWLVSRVFDLRIKRQQQEIYVLQQSNLELWKFVENLEGIICEQGTESEQFKISCVI